MRARRGLATRRAFEVAALALAGVVLLPILTARAQEGAPALGVYTLIASAAPVFETYNQPTFPVPATPSQEFSIGHSEVSLENGSAHGLASLLWPGNTAANFPAALHDLDPRFPVLPNYPVRAETFFPASEGQKSEDTLDTGAFSMRSTSSATEVTASAQTSDVEGVFSTGTVSSSTSGIVEGSLATTEARSSVTGFSLMGGVVKVDAVSSVATATSDGEKGKVTGRTLVTGVTIQDVEFSVDAEGVHLGREGVELPEDVDEQLNEQLAAAGLAMFVAEPLDAVNGATASRSIGGLIIVFTPKTLAQHVPREVLSALPPEVPSFVSSFDQTITIALGGVAVRTSAGNPPPLGPPPVPPVVGGSTGPGTAPEAPPAPVTTPPATTPTPSSSSGAPAGATLPAAAAAVGLVGVAATSRALRRVADKALTDVAAGTACPLGKA